MGLNCRHARRLPNLPRMSPAHEARADHSRGGRRLAGAPRILLRRLQSGRNPGRGLRPVAARKPLRRAQPGWRRANHRLCRCGTRTQRVSESGAEALFRERSDVSSKVSRLHPRQGHIRHLGMRIEKKKSQAIGVEAGISCDSRKWRRVAGSLALIACNHMTWRAPAARKLFTVPRVGSPARRAADCRSKGKPDQPCPNGFHAAATLLE